MQDTATSLCVFFEVGSSSKDKSANAQQFYVQFVTRYLHGDGSARVRVTTLSRRSATAPAARPPLPAV